MTTVNMALRVPKSDNTLVPAKGWVRWTPTQRLDLEGAILMPAPFMRNLVNGDVSVDVLPTTDDWFWTVEIHILDYSGKEIPVESKTWAVPDQSEVDFDDLQEILLTSTGPQPPLASWSRALQIERARIDEVLEVIGDLTEGEAGDIQSVAGLSSTIITAAALKTALSLPSDTANMLLDEIAERMAQNVLLEEAVEDETTARIAGDEGLQDQITGHETRIDSAETAIALPKVDSLNDETGDVIAQMVESPPDSGFFLFDVGGAGAPPDPAWLAMVVVLQEQAHKSLARNLDQLISGAITRDSNGAATSAPVVWPDGTPGTYTADTLSTEFLGAVDAYHVTYGSPVTKTYTQPAVTRNVDGVVTNLPAIVVT
jgi:hypothetical protein